MSVILHHHALANIYFHLLKEVVKWIFQFLGMRWCVRQIIHFMAQFIIIYYTYRLLGREAPIFHFHCEHVLFVYIVKQKFRGFIKKFSWFLKFSKIKFWWRQIFENSIIRKPSLGLREVPLKMWARFV